MLSAYRIMWAIVMFDLPTSEAKERRQAAQFRHGLQNLGFEMAQFSVYMRFFRGEKQAASYVPDIRAMLPPKGKVSIITITDKQFGNILSFEGRDRAPSTMKVPEQLTFL